MTFLDLFSGIGGFRLGMEMAEYKCIGHCEINKFADKSYRAMHKIEDGEWFEEDITKIDARTIPKADCWCFGFPCINISVSGGRTGLDGQHSSLFFAVTRLIKNLKEENKPSILFIENVKNLLSVNKGRDFTKLLIELDEIGYDVQWQLVDSANFVPQHRERIYIIGHLRGRSRAQIFPIRRENEKIHTNKTIPKYLSRLRKIGVIGAKHQGTVVYSSNGISTTITSRTGATSTNLYNVSKDQKLKIRYLTPKECFRLQGFPDNYFERAQKVNSNYQLYKQAGNSVTVPVIFEIAKRLTL